MRKSYIFNFQYMPCALTQGYVQDCRDSLGGAKAFYIIEFANIVSTTATANVITAITKTATKRFWKYVPVRDTGYAKETITSSVPNGTVYYAQELMFPLNKLQTNMRNEIMLLAQNRLAIVVVDANGKAWLFGQANGLDLSAGEAGTGTAPGDRNGYTMTFSGNEPALAIEVSTATIATLETPGT